MAPFDHSTTAHGRHTHDRQLGLCENRLDHSLLGYLWAGTLGSSLAAERTAFLMAVCSQASRQQTGRHWQEGKRPLFFRIFQEPLRERLGKHGVFQWTLKIPSNGTLKNAELFEFITSTAPGVVA
jgi:hypothetical protein